MASNPRRTNGTARTKLRRWLRSQGNPCALCGAPIDYSLPVGDPWSFEVDEIIPVSRWREGGYPSPEACALDRNNVQAAHRICNQKKGNAIRVVHEQTCGGSENIPLSRDWRHPFDAVYVAKPQQSGGSAEGVGGIPSRRPAATDHA